LIQAAKKKKELKRQRGERLKSRWGGGLRGVGATGSPPFYPKGWGRTGGDRTSFYFEQNRENTRKNEPENLGEGGTCWRTYQKVWKTGNGLSDTIIKREKGVNSLPKLPCCKNREKGFKGVAGLGAEKNRLKSSFCLRWVWGGESKEGNFAGPLGDVQPKNPETNGGERDNHGWRGGLITSNTTRKEK